MFDETFLAGESARIAVTVENLAGERIDPAVQNLIVLWPDGRRETIDPAALVRDGIGAYHYDLPLATASRRAERVYYRWETGAPATAAAEGLINVNPSRFVP